jgi:ABC-2 type transport system ATP-binding protein
MEEAGQTASKTIETSLCRLLTMIDPTAPWQRHLAAALMHDPKVLVLDEPTVGLDPRSARLIKDILKQMAERGSAIFLSTHILEIAERMCDRIGIINQGRLIAAGSMDDLRKMSQGETSLEDIFLNLTGGAEYSEIAEVLS